MTNDDLVQELESVRTTAAELRELLSKSDCLPALPLAEGLVETTKLAAKLRKLAVKIGKSAAPLRGFRTP